MAEHNIIGNLGEKIASNYLFQRGYEILELQWRFKHKEVDIIAQKDGVIHIVEVKTRSSESETESDHITQNKMQFLIEESEFYMQEKNLSSDLQFDVVVVRIFDKLTYTVKHIENAFVSDIQ